ncbi:MAG: diguanylate cyclase, partial [Deltaproteobacteria bacterium]|nr:diguanylate cyclase [Deltaproteobacteria bacterium]
LEKKLIGFNLGASDFLIKPYEEEELVARVKSLLRMRRLMVEIKEKNALLEKLAVTDELTGIFNRRHFFDEFQQQLALGLRHTFKVACLVMDIDHFKDINDTHGHVAGDEVLRKIGRLLNSCKRGGEIVARLGGEEFVICLFNTDKRSALLAAERFISLIRAYDFSSPNCPGLKNITVSIGLAILPRDAVGTVDDILKAADKAMYRSKANGRDRITVCEWEPEVTA